MAGHDLTETYAETRRERRRLLLGSVAGTLVAVVYAVVAIIDAWKPPGVDADYSRLGGQTRVETAAKVAEFEYGLPRADTASTPRPATAASKASAAPRAVLIPVDARPDLQLSAAALAVAERAPVSLLPRQRVVGLPAELEAAVASACVAPAFDASRWSVDVGSLRSCSPTSPPARSPVRLLVTNAAPVLQRALEDAGFEVMNPRKPEQLRENIVLVTASAVEDYPDVAVAIPLASAWDADIVVLPRRLEMDTDLRIALLEKTDEVRQGVVVGGPAVLEPELRTLLRAHARAAAAGRRQQALSEKSLVDSVVALVVGVVVFLAFRKSAEVFDMTADLPGGRRAALASLFGSARDRITRRSEHVPWGARLTTERCNARADDRRHHLKSRVDALVSELSTQLETLTAELERRARGPEAGGADGRISTAPDAGPVPPARDVEPVLRTLTRLRHALADLQTATSHATGDGHVLLFAAEYALLGWRLPGRLEQHVDGVQSARSLPDRRQQPLLFLRGVLRAVEADLDAPDPVVPNQTIARPDAPRALSGPGR